MLDVGCGAGDEIVSYEKLGIAEIHGIDPSSEMLNLARQKVRQPQNIRLGKFENTGYPVQFFDKVVGRFSLHYLQDIDNGYSEMARILKPGGLLAITASHPFADALVGNRTKIDGRDHITITIYNSVKITYPLHTLSEYFSSRFFEQFDLIDVQEFKEDFAKDSVVPNALAFAARKRTV